LYFDVETTGLDPVRNDIVQYSAIIVTPEEEDEIDLKMRPISSSIDDTALRIQGRTRREILTWPDPGDQFRVLEEWLGNHVDKFDPDDKFIPIAYNASFDIGFWDEYSRKCNFGTNYGIGSWVKRSCTQDPLAVIRFLERVGFIPVLDSHKLENVCTFFNIPIEAHDALGDVRALRMLDRLLVCLMNEESARRDCEP
jgi:DNA polymerase III epsilon subunit-like protein